VWGGCLRIIRRGLAPQVDQITRERESIAVGVERLGTVPQELCDSLQVVEERQLSRRIIPLAPVIVLDPGAGAARVSTWTWSVHQPDRSERQPITLPERARHSELLEPQPPLPGIQTLPMKRPATDA
jgi:hypothetical protein